MSCCNNIYPESDLRRWESCDSVQLANADNYYTKKEVDDLLDDIVVSGDGITADEAQDLIDSSLQDYYDKDEIDAAFDTVNDELDNKLDATAYTPTDLSGYWTSVETQEAINAATSGTPSSATIEGLRNDVNALSGDVYTNYYTKSAVDALIASLQSQIDALSECCSGGGDTGSTEGMKWLLHISGGTEASFPCNDPDDLLPNQIDDGEFTHSHQVFVDSDDYSSVTSAYVGDCVYGIMSHAFSGFTNMSAITVPDTLEVIDTHAFYHNYRLATFPYASSLTRIGDFAFSFCHSLTSATIPSGVTSIGQWAFEDCTGLTSVTMEDSTPPTLGNYAFYNQYGTEQLNITIYVPANAVETYKQATNWSDYASRIQAIP